MVRAIPFFAPEWTDHNLSDFGIVLQRLVAFVADVLHFYLDRMANEAFLATAITRRSVANHLRLINFELRSAVPASVDVEFSLQEALIGDLLIPAGTVLQTTADATEEPIFFETTQDVVIVAGSLTVTAPAVEGQTQSEEVGLSEGIERQRFPLRGLRIIDGTRQLFIDEGIGEELWIEVETFVGSDPEDKHFTSQLEEETGITDVFFGDNNQGKIPATGASIRGQYRVGGGTRGNVAPGTITTVNATFTFNGDPVVLAVTNPEQASGGEDEMSIDEGKRLGPQSFQALNRAVTPFDWKALAESFPGVDKATIEIGGTSVQRGLPCCCTISLTIAPSGGGLPSSQLKADLLAFFEDRKMAGTCLVIADPQYEKVDIEGTVVVANNFGTEGVAEQTLAQIDQFFGLQSDFIEFGRPIFLSDLFALVDNVPGVDHADFIEVTCQPEARKDVGLAGCEFSRILVGTRAEIETWTVIFTSPTTFTVRGTVSGLQANTGTVGVEYVADQGQVTFTITCASGAPKTADRASFDTCKKFANVPVQPDQVPVKGRVNLTFVGGGKIQRECPT